MGCLTGVGAGRGWHAYFFVFFLLSIVRPVWNAFEGLDFEFCVDFRVNRLAALYPFRILVSRFI